MRKVMLILGTFSLAIGITACGGNNDNNSGSGSSSSNNGGQKSSVDASAAKKVYKQNCASCHGDNLQGQNGPELDHIGKKMSKDDIKKQIKNGGGGMPAGIIKGDKAENVASWLANKK